MLVTDSSVSHHVEITLVQTVKEHLLSLVSEDLNFIFQKFPYKVCQYLLKIDILLAPYDF